MLTNSRMNYILNLKNKVNVLSVFSNLSSLNIFLGLNCLQIDCNSIQNSTAKQTESKINSMIQKAKAAAPAIVLMDSFDVCFSILYKINF